MRIKAPLGTMLNEAELRMQLENLNSSSICICIRCI